MFLGLGRSWTSSRPSSTRSWPRPASSPTWSSSSSSLSSSQSCSSSTRGASQGMNCIKIGLPGKLILSKRKGLREVLFSWKLSPRINFPGRPIFIQLPPGRWLHHLLLPGEWAHLQGLRRAGSAPGLLQASLRRRLQSGNKQFVLT